MATLLNIQNISSGYGTTPILRNISFSVERGEFIGILGPNGSGKTTLINTLTNVCTRMQGDIVLDGKHASTLSQREIARHIAIVPQQQFTSCSLSVYDFVLLGRFVHASSVWHSHNDDDHAAVENALAMTSLASYRSRSMATLSCGEVQRVLIAQGLAQAAPLIILDEPIAHLDLRYQYELLDMLTTLHAQGLTIIAIMHDIALAYRFFQRLIVFKNGTVYADGTPQHVCTETMLHDVFNLRCSLSTRDNMLLIQPMQNAKCKMQNA